MMQEKADQTARFFFTVFDWHTFDKSYALCDLAPVLPGASPGFATVSSVHSASDGTDEINAGIRPAEKR